jgi:pyruvate/2-oxoglutarate dehydrogenase complex dihydrolipoamide acyltransferase (E2) component
LTTTLNYGEINRRGVVNVRLIYDHRVLDGATVARVLYELEEALRGTMVRELASISPLASAA